MGVYKVLLVDDEAEIRECVEIIARHDDLVFEQAPNGAEGLKMILENNYDCVVSDIKMPQMNGVDMLKRLREAGKDVPVVFISAFANEEFAHEVSEYGAVKLLHKLEMMKVRERILEAIKLADEIRSIHKDKDKMGEDFLQILNRTGGK